MAFFFFFLCPVGHTHSEEMSECKRSLGRAVTGREKKVQS